MPRQWTTLAVALALLASPALAQRARRAPKPLPVPKVVLEEEPEPGQEAPEPGQEAPREGSPASGPDEAPVEAEPEEKAPAEGDEESVQAPELGGAEVDGSGAASLAASGGGEEIVADPELSAISGAEPSSFGAPGDEPARWRLLLHTRWGLDTQWSLPSKEVIEGTTIGLVEVDQRLSETLKLSLGVRGRHAVGRREGGMTRYELDAAPTAAFADVALGSAAHLRLGYQVISIGRFDVFSAANVLGVSDLRSGPVTMPDAGHIAQPAVRLDVDPTPGLTVQAFYVPFFQPHLIAVYGGDYALMTYLERRSDQTLDTANREAVEQLFGRSTLGRLSRESFSAFAPDPSLNEPQGAIRATIHGSPGEVAFTLATALERFPALSISDRLAVFLDNPGIQPPPDFLPGPNGEPPVNPLTPDDFRVAYGRYYLMAIDGATDIGAVQVGAELAYMKDRTLIAMTPAPAVVPGDPNPPTRVARDEQVDIVQVGLRGETTPSDSLALGAEVFVARPLSEPAPGYGWFGFEESGWTRGLAAGMQWKPTEGLALELGGLLASGISFVGLPRIEWEPVTRLYLELGAAIVEGTAPGPLGTPTTSVGGLYDGTDQVFAGVRWLM